MVDNINPSKDGVVKFRRRRGNTRFYSKDILYLVLLPRFCSLSGVIMDCHEKCKPMGITVILIILRRIGLNTNMPRLAFKNVICSGPCKEYSVLALRYPKVTNGPKEEIIYDSFLIHDEMTHLHCAVMQVN